ncbi:MAG: DUF4221 family protein [Bacteroidota bacterium]
MNYRTGALSFAFFTILICCRTESNETKSISKDIFTLNPIKEINFRIDSITPLNSISMWYFEGKNNEPYFSYAVNKFKYKIFSLTEQNEVFGVNIKKEGPDGISSVRGGLFPLNENEFLIGEMSTPHIYRIDREGNILGKYNYAIDSKYGRNTDAGTTRFGNKPFVVENGKIYGGDFFFGPWGNWEESYVFSKPLILEIDTTNGGTGSTLPITLPKNLWDNGARLPLPLYDFAQGHFVLSITGDHNVYKVGFDGTISSYRAKSRYINEFEDYPLKATPPEYFKYYVLNGAYNSIIYDKYRDIYYRFVILPDNPNEEIDWLRAKKHPKRSSIIILDNEFRVLGETLLPKDKHYIYNSFVSRDGLYISNSHLDNPEIKEDILTFTLFKYEQYHDK